MIFDRAIRNSMEGGAAGAGQREILTLSDPTGWRIGGDFGIESGNQAMKLSAVYRCVQVITDSMSKFPHFVMDGRTKERLNPHYLLYPLNIRANEAMAPSVLRKLAHADRLLEGNGYIYLRRSPSTGRVMEMLPLRADCTRPKLDAAGKLWYHYSDPLSGKVFRLNQADVVHYKGYSKDGINGISVLAHAREVVATGLEMQGYNHAFFKNNAQPPGVLTVEGKLDKPAKDKVRKEWEDVYAGADNAFRVAVLDLGLKYESIAVQNKDSQFVQNKDVSVVDIARFFGVPLYKLMAGKQSYNSNEQNGIEYVKDTLLPIVSQCEEEDTYKMLPDRDVRKGIEIKQNMMAELRGDSASRAAWYKAMREVGYFSVNDICDLEDTQHVPGGDTRNASLNYVPLELFGELSIARNGENGR